MLEYTICDVFTDRPLTGNALAVFTDANHLDDGIMQALAREMNLSESAFVLRPTRPDADARLRIFTPTIELPFAGHPTLGAAFILGASISTELVRLETSSGVVPVRLTREGGRIVFGWMTQPLPTHRPFPDGAELLRGLGAPRSLLPIDIYDNGPRYVYVELASRDAVAQLRPDLRQLASLGRVLISVFAGEGEHWKCRVFAPGAGVSEDPATGSAAGALALHLARHGRIRFGDQIIIEQGAELGRPSTLYARAVGRADRLEALEVGGAAVAIGRGTLIAFGS